MKAIKSMQCYKLARNCLELLWRFTLHEYYTAGTTMLSMCMSGSVASEYTGCTLR